MTTTLEPSLATLAELLIGAAGEFVSREQLAKTAGVPMFALAGFIKQLRMKRPDFIIEGRPGKGYRLASQAPGAAAADLSRPLQDQSAERHAAGRAMLDLLPPPTAELVKTIALASGETADSCIERLIAYGAEVHHSLVGDGQNPLGLNASGELRSATHH